MKSFVAQTYFHLMRSIAMALEMPEKPNLYMITDYLDIEDNMLGRIAETGVFNSVTPLDYKVFQRDYIEDLKLTKDLAPDEIDEVGNSIFEKHLTPYFTNAFAGADRADEIFVFNDVGWYFYFVERNFNNIVGVEDSYNGLELFLRIVAYQGNSELVIPFIGKYYPLHCFRSEKIQTIISSVACNDVSEEYKNRICVSDYLKLIEKNKLKFVEALLHIFDLSGIAVEPNSTIYLTQPISRARYCTPRQAYLINKKLIRDELKECDYLYIKPHPADDFDYELLSNERIRILPRKMPVEIFGLINVKFSKSITFDSTSINGSEFANHAVKLYHVENKSRETFTNFLKNYVSKEYLTVSYYYLAPELNSENYVCAYSYLLGGKKINRSLYILIDENKRNEAESFFAISSLNMHLKNYVRNFSDGIDKAYRRKIALKIRSHFNRIEQKTPAIIPLCDFEKETVLTAITSVDATPDFFMIAGEQNLGISINELFQKKIDKVGVPFVMSYIQYIVKYGRKYFLYPDTVENCIYGSLSAKIWHGRLLDAIRSHTVSDHRSVEKFSEKFQKHYTTYSGMVRVNQHAYFSPTENMQSYVREIEKIYNEEVEKTARIDRCSVVVLRYINYLFVFKNGIKSEDIAELLEKASIGENDRLKVMSTVTGFLVSQVDIDKRKALFQNYEAVSYGNKILSRALQNGLIQLILSAFYSRTFRKMFAMTRKRRR